MAKKGAKVERSQVNSSQPYEVKYLAEKLDVSSQAIMAAKRATGSSDCRTSNSTSKITVHQK